MSGARQVASAPPAEVADTYLRALALVLVGYAVLGKGIAYAGIPPLYVGEMLFLGGLLMLFRSGCFVATLTVFPNLVLLVLAGWVALRTAPFVGTYGIDALRDSVVVLYAGFGFTVCALLVERPSRLPDALRFLGAFAMAFGAGGGLLYVLSKSSLTASFSWPGAPVPIIFIRSGEVATHLAGAALYALLLAPRVRAGWVLMLVLGIGVIAAQSRGGMLAIIVPVALAAVISGRLARLSRVGIVIGLLFTLGLALQLEVTVGEVDERTGASEARTFSADQFLRNAASIVDDNAPADLSGTKRWRLMWWDAIQDYTFRGPYFWTGKGFGIGLAVDDGFVVWETDGQTTVRSPHNVSITMLARAGVPGLALWLLLLVSWFGMMMRSMAEAHRRGEPHWAHAFLFVAGYLLSIFINASFDVALEGPMLGVWFWSLFGLGTAASMIYRSAGQGRA